MTELVVGLTYDLREEQTPYDGAPPDYYAEFDSQTNIDHLYNAITSLGYRVERIGNLTKLFTYLSNGGKVDLVFNMAEGMWGRSREGHIQSMLEAFRIPYTGSDPLAASLCLDKSLAKRLWLCEGLPTARFALISRLEDCDRVLEALPIFPLFVKPAYEGSSKGVSAESIIHNAEQLQMRAEVLLRLYRQPVIVEQYLAGQEYTVGIVGSGEYARAVGVVQVKAVSPSGVNGFFDKEQWDRHITDHFVPVVQGLLADELCDLALRAYRSLGCQDVGRVDLRCDASGRPFLLEINPIPGFHPTHAAITTVGRFAGLSYEHLVGEVIDSARRRWGLM